MHIDLSTSGSVEQARRSMAMLAPRAWALRREDAMELLEVLCVALRQLEAIDEAVRRYPAGDPRLRGRGVFALLSPREARGRSR